MGFRETARIQTAWQWVKRCTLPSDLDELLSSAKPVNSFPVGYSFCFYKTARTIEKEKYEGDDRSLRTHKQTASFRCYDSVPTGNCLLFLFLLHAVKCTFAITTLPGRVSFKKQLLGNLQLPKMIYKAPLKGQTKSQYPAIPQTNRCFPAAEQRDPAMAEGH